MKQYLCKKKLILSVLTVLFIILLSGCSFEALPDSPKANGGLLDVTGWNFNKDGNIQLDGQWEFYWEKFLGYSDFQSKKPDLYSIVPEIWNGYTINGKNISGQGYATYRLHVKTELPEAAMLGLRIYTFSSAYSMYVNDRLIASNGKVGRSISEEIGEYKPQAVFFTIPAKEFDIIIQVSNFQYARGGFWYSIYIGSVQGIMGLHESFLEKETFLLGVLGIISAFFLTVFILKRELRYSLYFACLCMAMTVAVDSLGQFVLLGLLPGLSLKCTIFLWYSSSVWVFYFLILFMHELFKSKISSVVIRVYLIAIIIFQVIFIFTDTAFYTRWFAQVIDFVNLIGALCAVIIIAIGIRKGQKDGWLNISGIFIALLTYIHDDLYWMNIITSRFGEMTYAGLFTFLFTQMLIQAKRIKQFYDHKTAAELNFLQAQIKPHFLYNAINTFISISRYNMDQARNLLINFSDYLRRSFDFKDLSQLAPLKSELELVRAYLEIEKARFEERIEVAYDLPDDLEARVPVLILQPIVENAVIHGILLKDEGGLIEICIKRDETALYFKVKDNGVGIEPGKKDNIFKHQFGSGVGLSNIDKRLKKLYGKGLQINSISGVGTEVIWRVPVNRRRVNEK